MKRRGHHSLDFRRAGWSLLELLIVVGIVLLLGAVLFSSGAFMRSRGVTRGGDLLRETLTLSRDLAIAKNQPVEVWFVRPSSGGGPLPALQICLVGPSGEPAPYGELRRLPGGVGVDSGDKLSSLLVAANAKQWGGAVAKPALPEFATGYECWYVRFLPDGSTTLPMNSQWYLTLHETGLGDGLSALPANYAMVAVAPATGRITLYRP